MTAPNPRTDATAATGRGFGGLSERHGRMLVLVGKRIAQMPIVLLVVSILTFWLVQVVPGDPGRETLGQYATGAQVHAWDIGNGLTGSTLTRYLNWLHGFLTGRWGSSFVFSVPNRGLVLGHLLNSALLGALAFVLMVPFSVILGSAQAYREGRRSDRLITIATSDAACSPERSPAPIARCSSARSARSSRR